MFLCEDYPYEKTYQDYYNLTLGRSKGSRFRPKYGIDGYIHLRGRWEQMMERCCNPKSRYYKVYGGRGIGVSDEFKDCPTYCKYINSLPRREGQNQVDRIDNSKGYIRGNLRWVTSKENNANKRTNVMVEWEGNEYCFEHFAERFTKLSTGYARRLFTKGATLEELSKWIPKGLRYYKRKQHEKVSGN